MARADKKNRREPVTLSRKVTVGAAFRQFIAASNDALLRLERDAPKADPDTVHHFRTAIRRLRSLLATFKPMLPPGPCKELTDRLKTLAQHYGPLRELDVFIDALKEPRRPDNPRRAGFETLARAARLARREEQAKNGRLAQDIVTLDRALASADWLRAPMSDAADLWDERLSAFAPKLLDKQRKQMLKRAKKLDLSDPESFHKFRINTKKHRYLIEFIDFLYKHKKEKRYLDRLVAIQDILGELHDADTASNLLARLPVNDETRSLAMSWLAERMAESRLRFVPCAESFRDGKPFWN